MIGKYLCLILGLGMVFNLYYGLGIFFLAENSGKQWTFSISMCIRSLFVEYVLKEEREKENKEAWYCVLKIVQASPPMCAKVGNGCLLLFCNQ